jgi:hypothetical protein
MYTKEYCKSLQNVAYRSCIDSYFETKDREDIVEYWVYLLKRKRLCEAQGVEKALELIDIYIEIKE